MGSIVRMLAALTSILCAAAVPEEDDRFSLVANCFPAMKESQDDPNGPS